jgi:putative ABC transport system ATP-binding protein
LDPNLFRYIWRHSRREQLIILLIITVSLPFYWISLDVPKRIVNDAIQGRAFQHGHVAHLFEGELSLPDFLGGGKFLEIPGIPLSQMSYLFALSGIYFLLVLVNGWFKYLINIRKGVLGERMMQRMRFDLFALLLRFRPEDIRAVKPAEVASMIKDEVEPIGSFIGDAFIQPAFLGTQALTALCFIMLQNFWMGLVAFLIVLIQAVVIPYLRREQIRLGRLRQLASRTLAGRIGEIVDAADTVHVHGAASYMEADVDQHLRGLYKIRVDLYRRKFAVKYLNNLLAQLTPFFFYAIGGYFALQNALNIGQLVAVIAAYRDLPPPIKELIDWDQQRNDVDVKYEQIVTQFTP